MALLYIFFLLCSAVFVNSGEIEEAIGLQDKINTYLKEAKELNITLTDMFKTSDFDKWLKDVQDIKLKDLIEDLQARYNELQYQFNKTSGLLINYKKDWEGKIPEEQVQQTGSKIQQAKEKLDVITNQASNQSSIHNRLQKEYQHLDELVQTHETRYLDFDKRISDLQKRVKDDQDKTEAHEHKREELMRMVNLTTLEKTRMRLEVEIITKKNQKIEEMVKQLEDGIKVLKETGIQKQVVASENQIIATDHAYGKGKKIRLLLTT